MKFKKKLVSRIRELRDQHDMNQQNLADMLGVSRQTIYYLEKGSYNPSLSLSFKISEVFNKSIEEIFYFEPEIREVIGSKTVDELVEIEKKTGISTEKLFKLKSIDDKELSESFNEIELSKIAKALNVKFEELFMQDDELL